MRRSHALVLVALLAIFAVSCSPGETESSVGRGTEIPKEQVLTERSIHTSKGTFKIVKYRDKDGKPKEIVYDSTGKIVRQEDIPKEDQLDSGLGVYLQKTLANTPEALKEETVEISVYLDDSVPFPEAPDDLGAYDRGNSNLELNGVQATDKELDDLNKTKADLRKKYLASIEAKRRDQLNLLITRESTIKLTQDEIDEYAKSNAALILKMKLKDVAPFYERNKDIIVAVELKTGKEPSDGSLRTAMRKTNVDDKVLRNIGNQGKGVGIYMTERGCPYHLSYNERDEPRATEIAYRRLAGYYTEHSQNVSSILHSVAPKSVIYCRGGAVMPTQHDLDNANPPIRVMNRSNGYSGESGYTEVDMAWDDFIYQNSILLVNSAGNEGLDEGYVGSPAKGLNVLSVGNYDDSNSTIRASSSWVDPSNTKNSKPEVCAPGTNINAGISNFDEQEIVMTGTSQAAPHVTGIIADLIGVYPQLVNRPYLQKAFVVGGAYQSISGGSDRTGWGGVDFAESMYYGKFWWWEGSNDLFERLGKSGNIDVHFNVTSKKKTRIVLSWLNRGSWTLRHKASIHPIGMDIDFSVYDPSGNYVGGAYSWDDSTEVYTFTPNKLGNYRISIYRFANRDTSSRVLMGLDVGTNDY